MGTPLDAVAVLHYAEAIAEISGEPPRDLLECRCAERTASLLASPTSSSSAGTRLSEGVGISRVPEEGRADRESGGVSEAVRVCES
ncbi:hypothetical protein [Paracoccus sp. S-4012]|uniref:hypothetical protein n=1 Tax=Paracoccus sp. S-4012 TaxID=2665648 RepID=UPI00351B8250